mmetsp:Transcript_12515/g.26980  ORF Transcript_12515/g.26980 Transcript_12515/m.26980 type:complete len:271 (-) Transcript_12515:237-1049(-)
MRGPSPSGTSLSSSKCKMQPAVNSGSAPASSPPSSPGSSSISSSPAASPSSALALLAASRSPSTPSSRPRLAPATALTAGCRVMAPPTLPPAPSGSSSLEVSSSSSLMFLALRSCLLRARYSAFFSRCRVAPSCSSFMANTLSRSASLANSTNTEPLKARDLKWRLMRTQLTTPCLLKKTDRSSKRLLAGKGRAYRLRASTSLLISSLGLRGCFLLIRVQASLTSTISDPLSTSAAAVTTSAGTVAGSTVFSSFRMSFMRAKAQMMFRST